MSELQLSPYLTGGGDVGRPRPRSAVGRDPTVSHRSLALSRSTSAATLGTFAFVVAELGCEVKKSAGRTSSLFVPAESGWVVRVMGVTIQQHFPTLTTVSH